MGIVESIKTAISVAEVQAILNQAAKFEQIHPRTLRRLKRKAQDKITELKGAWA